MALETYLRPVLIVFSNVKKPVGCGRVVFLLNLVLLFTGVESVSVFISFACIFWYHDWWIKITILDMRSFKAKCSLKSRMCKWFGREGRVMGVLEVSRSIGDGPFKKHGVSCIPDVKRCQLQENDK